MSLAISACLVAVARLQLVLVAQLQVERFLLLNNAKCHFQLADSLARSLRYSSVSSCSRSNGASIFLPFTKRHTNDHSFAVAFIADCIHRKFSCWTFFSHAFSLGEKVQGSQAIGKKPRAGFPDIAGIDGVAGVNCSQGDILGRRDVLEGTQTEIIVHAAILQV
jgi:hypothetical protein